MPRPHWAGWRQFRAASLEIVGLGFIDENSGGSSVRLRNRVTSDGMTPKIKSFWLASLGPVMVILNLGVIVLIGWFVLKYPDNFLLRTVDRLFGIIPGALP